MIAKQINHPSKALISMAKYFLKSVKYAQMPFLTVKNALEAMNAPNVCPDYIFHQPKRVVLIVVLVF